jgi:hypothetical protein
MRGEERRPGAALIRLLARGEGWPTVVHGVATPARGARRWASWASVRVSGRERKEGAVGRDGPRGRADWAR